MPLVIVESPAKARTISHFLGKDYNVLSSYGHVRDLPKSKLGVDPDHDFIEQYVTPPKARKVITALKAAAKKEDKVILATDEDREGEAIAWHIMQALGLHEGKAQNKKGKTVERIVFHEITKEAILDALAHPRGLDMNLIDAQRARRVLDRLVGYKLSPLLWKKIARGLSAGRVQSVALRLVVDREREREAFKSQEYWTIEAEFETPRQEKFKALLNEVNSEALTKFALASETGAKDVLAKIESAAGWQIAKLEEKDALREPPPPFMTATLQQEAAYRLGFSAKLTMQIAQQLYEGIDVPGHGHVGLITYMRTDSFTLAEKAISQAASFIRDRFGESYLRSRQYKNRAKTAQEAHEAIRPTHFTLDPDSLQGVLDPRQHKLYKLIWSRALASQMAPAQLKATIVKAADNAKAFLFEARGQIIKFDGFLKVYPLNVKDELLPKVTEGEPVKRLSTTPVQHFTKPPARYSEAMLVKALKDHGIGRPSTYAPTIETLYFRKYVERDEDKRLNPTDLGKAVTGLLTEHFPDIVDIQFTAHLEDDLDEIANGQKPWVPIIRTFYEPFIKRVTEKETEIVKKDFSEKPTDKVCPDCGKPMVLKFGRFGQFYSCSGWPDCKHAEPIVNKVGVKCPVCKEGDMIARKTRRGKIFYGCNKYPACKTATWNLPTGELCPSCGKPTSFKGKDKVITCENKECETNLKLKAQSAKQ